MSTILEKRKQFSRLINHYQTLLNIYSNDYSEFKSDCESDQLLDISAQEKIDTYELIYETLTVINEAGRNQVLLNELKNQLEKQKDSKDFDIEYFENSLTKISCNLKLLKFIDSHMSIKMKAHKVKIKNYLEKKDKSLSVNNKL